MKSFLRTVQRKETLLCLSLTDFKGISMHFHA